MSENNARLHLDSAGELVAADPLARHSSALQRLCAFPSANWAARSSSASAALLSLVCGADRLKCDNSWLSNARTFVSPVFSLSPSGAIFSRTLK